MSLGIFGLLSASKSTRKWSDLVLEGQIKQAQFPSEGFVGNYKVQSSTLVMGWLKWNVLVQVVVFQELVKLLGVVFFGSFHMKVEISSDDRRTRFP